jgi:hypothetical protein
MSANVRSRSTPSPAKPVLPVRPQNDPPAAAAAAAAAAPVPPALPLPRMHVPSEQTLPAGQALPHLPQFRASVEVSTQLVPQTLTAPPQAHVDTQIPDTQGWAIGLQAAACFARSAVVRIRREVHAGAVAPDNRSGQATPPDGEFMGRSPGQRRIPATDGGPVASARPDGTLLTMPSGAPTDTHPMIEAILVEGYRRMSPAQKLARVTELTRAVQLLALADVRRHYPTASAEEQALRVASRWLEPELMRRAFGWNVDETGF